MTDILIAVGIVTIVGAVAGVGLAIASVIMAVPKNEKAEEIAAALPGANCGACGFSGCSAYAEAIANGEAQPGLCTPGGAATAAKLSEILGVEVDSQRKFAFVGCGGCDKDSDLEYKGVPSCAGANMFYGGTEKCSFSCLGYGDCAAVCAYGAIDIKDGVASINIDKCSGCGKCAAACPKGIISVISPTKKRIAAVGCSNKDKGKAVASVCSHGCIACTKCVKECNFNAIEMVNNLPKIDEGKCLGCGKCAKACPTGVIQIIKV